MVAATPGMSALRSLLLLVSTTAACRHDCAVSGRVQAGFAIQSCCTGQAKYYWDNDAKDCVALPANGGQNCGCVCQGKDCDRLFWSREQCREEYGHCR